LFALDFDAQLGSVEASQEPPPSAATPIGRGAREAPTYAAFLRVPVLELSENLRMVVASSFSCFVFYRFSAVLFCRPF
jgi:hypothetical protein